MIHKKTTKKLYHHHNSTPSLYNVAKSSILLFSYAKRDVLLTIDNFFYWTGSNVWRAGERACLGVRRYKRRVGSCAPPSPYIFRGVTNAFSSPSSGHHEVPGKNHLNKNEIFPLFARDRGLHHLRSRTEAITIIIQTWNLSKILHNRIFGPKILQTKNA